MPTLSSMYTVQSRPTPKRASLRVIVDSTQVTMFIKRLAEGVDDFRPFWVHYFAPQFFRDIQDNFASSGKYVGGWRALSPGYAAWKAARYGRLPILVLTGRMRESLTIGGRGNVLKAGKTTFEGGSNDPKIERHQKGIGVPVRKVLFIRGNAAYQKLLRTFVADMTREAQAGRSVA